MKVENGIYMLEILCDTNGTPTIIYPTLISNNDSLILIDTGFPGLINQIYEAIEKEGLQFSKLDTIIFTHQDIDHIGNVHDILKKVPGGIKTFSHEEEKAYINGERTPVKLAKLQSNLEILPDNMKVAYNMLKAGFEKNRVTIQSHSQNRFFEAFLLLMYGFSPYEFMKSVLCKQAYSGWFS